MGLRDAHRPGTSGWRRTGAPASEAAGWAGDRTREPFGPGTLFIKDESPNPTGSFKARGMAVAVSRAVELEIGRAHV